MHLHIAAGGTGGHMFPAQALAEYMLTAGWRVSLSTDPRGARYTGGFPEAVDQRVLKSATFARGGLVSKALVAPRIASGTAGAIAAFMRDRPDVVVGFGGYPSIPAMAAATVLRLPRMLHEQNGVLGRVNQLFARRVSHIACGTWPTELPQGVPHSHTGNPVRAAIAARQGAPYIAPGDHPMEVLVLGGSQGARILSDVVPPALAQLPMEMLAHLRVAHQARPEDMDRVTQYYAEHAIRADVQPFFRDVPERLANAQLIISRAGASTVADIATVGRPSVLIPLAAAIRDEQTANARGLVDAGAAVLMPESKCSVDQLHDTVRMILTDPEGARQMASAALAQATPDATRDLAALVHHLATGDPL